MAIKKKTVLPKPAPKAPLKPRVAPPNADAESTDEEEPEATLAPAALPDTNDELALQETTTTNYPGEKFKRPRKKEPVQNTGTSLDIHDTSKLLMFAWIIIGAVVAISIYLLLVHADKSEEEVSRRNNDGTTPTVNAPTTPASAAVTKPATPKPAEKEAARFAGNPANKSAVEAYLKFGNWAYTEALNWDGKQLTEKLNSDVRLGSVDDPDVRELIRLQAENFALLNSHPLRPYEAPIGGTGEATRANDSANLAAFKQNENKIKGLTSSLRQRYSINPK